MRIAVVCCLFAPLCVTVADPLIVVRWREKTASEAATVPVYHSSATPVADAASKILKTLLDPGSAVFAEPVATTYRGRPSVRLDFEVPAGYRGPLFLEGRTLEVERLEIARDGDSPFRGAVCEPGAGDAEPPQETLPPGLLLETETREALDLAGSDAGDAFSVVLTRAVRKDGLVLPKGSRLAGRITRLEQQTAVLNGERTSYYVAGVKIDRVAGGGRTWAVCAALDGVRSTDRRFVVPSSDRMERGSAWQQAASAAQPAACEGVFLAPATRPVIERGVRFELRTMRPG
jgi:hypothetical protein